MIELPEQPIHPGEVLAEVYMKPTAFSLTVTTLAESIDVSPMELSMFIVGRQSVTPSLAARLAIRFQTTTEYWLGLQRLYDQQSRPWAFLRTSGHFVI